jgi:hypothetical protein
MPSYPYYCDCPRNIGNFNRTAFLFIGFLGVGAAILTSALRSTERRVLPLDELDGARQRIKVLEAQVDRAFNAVMAMIVLVLAVVLTTLISSGMPLSHDRSEL